MLLPERIVPVGLSMSKSLQAIEAVFCAALELPDPEQRRRLLERECAGSEAMRVEVERLLACHAEAENFFAEITLLWNDHPPTPSGPRPML
jgi:hypothetical protein